MLSSNQPEVSAWTIWDWARVKSILLCLLVSLLKDCWRGSWRPQSRILQRTCRSWKSSLMSWQRLLPTMRTYLEVKSLARRMSWASHDRFLIQKQRHPRSTVVVTHCSNRTIGLRRHSSWRRARKSFNGRVRMHSAVKGKIKFWRAFELLFLEWRKRPSRQTVIWIQKHRHWTLHMGRCFLAEWMNKWLSIQITDD